MTTPTKTFTIRRTGEFRWVMAVRRGSSCYGITITPKWFTTYGLLGSFREAKKSCERLFSLYPIERTP